MWIHSLKLSAIMFDMNAIKFTNMRWFNFSHFHPFFVAELKQSSPTVHRFSNELHTATILSGFRKDTIEVSITGQEHGNERNRSWLNSAFRQIINTIRLILSLGSFLAHQQLERMISSLKNHTVLGRPKLTYYPFIFLKIPARLWRKINKQVH